MAVDDDSDFAPACALPSLRALQTSFPQAPKAELRRFARKRPKSPSEAIDLYKDYLQWRNGKGSPASLARAYSLVPPELYSGIEFQGPAKDGTPVIFIEMGRFAPDVVSDEVYALALAHLMDVAYSREQEGHFTVVVDTRAGEGWPNPKPAQLMGFLKHLLVVSRMCPDRMKRIIIYPVPWFAGMFVSMCKRMVDASTRDKLYIISGDQSEACPAEELSEFLVIGSLPVRSWHRHKNLDPAKVAMMLKSYVSSSETKRQDGTAAAEDDEFYSASEGGEWSEDPNNMDLESGLFMSSSQVEEKRRFSLRCFLRWRWPCRLLCPHRLRHRQ
eukprot:TRINITY_DN55984_c0_g1_i1.p1 TRINITY_DN55984_c0_g1~~TRINITY_DN55984_c0_g1_i1.p1  ORF type:complete len:329 (+),score=35.06 TRINITY_DN55984_c0_g1_i1:43-1029(+)